MPINRRPSRNKPEEREERSSRSSVRGAKPSRSRESSGAGRYRGDEGIRRSEEERERQKEQAEARRNQTHMPFRFRVPVGETREAIIVDDKPDFFQYEHNMKGSDGKWNVFTGCVKEFDNCPVCESQNRESYYAMYLTVIDLHPFETRGGEEVEFSRKLLVVKPQQQKKFLRFYEKEGTLRGATFEFTRDGDKDSSIGNDIEFIEFVDEDVLETYVREWKDKDKKKHTEDCSQPFDYDELFEEPDTDKLRALVGGKPAPGSRDEARRELGSERRRGRRGSSEEEEEEDERPARRGAAATRRGKKEESSDMEDWEEPEDGEGPPWSEGDEEKPKRGRTVRGRDKDEEEDEPEEKPARGRAGRTTPARTAPARRGRADEEEPEDEEEEEPKRGPARRVQPRRGR